MILKRFICDPYLKRFICDPYLKRLVNMSVSSDQKVVFWRPTLSVRAACLVSRWSLSARPWISCSCRSRFSSCRTRFSSCRTRFSSCSLASDRKQEATTLCFWFFRFSLPTFSVVWEVHSFQQVPFLSLSVVCCACTVLFLVYTTR